MTELQKIARVKRKMVLSTNFIAILKGFIVSNIKRSEFKGIKNLLPENF